MHPSPAPRLTSLSEAPYSVANLRRNPRDPSHLAQCMCLPRRGLLARPHVTMSCSAVPVARSRLPSRSPRTPPFLRIPIPHPALPAPPAHDPRGLVVASVPSPKEDRRDPRHL